MQSGRADDLGSGWTTDGSPPRKVGIAEYAVATGEETLATSGLGSCVAVALRDDRVGVAGLVHAMLPSASTSRDGNPAKFVDTGVRTLLSAAERAGADAGRIEATLVGGGQMFDFDGDAVGPRNVVAAREVCAELGLPVVADDVGGSHGRSLRLTPASGRLVVRAAGGDATPL